MQQVSKVILFFTRRKICRSSEASAQIRRVKKRYFTNFTLTDVKKGNFSYTLLKKNITQRLHIGENIYLEKEVLLHFFRLKKIITLQKLSFKISRMQLSPAKKIKVNSTRIDKKFKSSQFLQIYLHIGINKK
jgi:hypothetical protein